MHDTTSKFLEIDVPSDQYHPCVDPSYDEIVE